jgi:Sel1 repeat
MSGGAIAATSCSEISDAYSETADAPLLLATRLSPVNRESLDRRTKLSIGGILYLTSNGLVAATVIVMCFGSGFLMLGSQPGGMLSRSGARANLEAGSVVRNGFLGSDHSAGVASRGRTPEASEVGRSAAALPSAGASSAEVESPPPHPLETAPLEPPAAATLLPSAAAAPPSPAAAAPPSPAAAAPPSPAAAAPPSRPAATVPSSQASFGPVPGLSAAEIGELLEHGDSLLRTGDIVSARLFYERAAAAGDGHAALRVAATFDPDFLSRLGLGKVQADAAEARFWYSRAIELGAADARRQLDKISTGQGR